MDNSHEKMEIKNNSQDVPQNNVLANNDHKINKEQDKLGQPILLPVNPTALKTEENHQQNSEKKEIKIIDNQDPNIQGNNTNKKIDQNHEKI